jgi:hypothetical protein
MMSRPMEIPPEAKAKAFTSIHLECITLFQAPS